MATNRRPPAERDGGLDALRRVHDELRRRHQSLLRQVAAAAITDAELVRLGCFALQRSTSGFALVRDGRVRLTNDRWRELGRRARRWTVADGGPARVYGDLGSLATTEFARLDDESAVVRMVVRDGDRRVLRMWLEPLPATTPGGGGMVVLDDVTLDRERADELARLRDTIVQRERLSALGQLAGGIVHDLGNTVAALRARLELAALGDAAGARRQLGHMIAAVDNMRATLDRLQRFSAQGGVGATPVDLRAVIETAVDMMTPALGGGTRRRAVEVELALPRRLPAVVGHAADLQSVFINLLLNARDAMPAGGTVFIAARAARGRVTVTVRDQGPGVTPEHLPRLFEPFFTTQAAAGHSGLGLSLARGIVHAANGTIGAANHAAGGLQITLELRIARRRR